jgi:hypothetical protein
MKLNRLNVGSVNQYLINKQHLLPTSRDTDLTQVTREIAALHATAPTGPYLSLFARVPDLQRSALEGALYSQRTLARILCMRTTLHIVPADELAVFFQAYAEQRIPVELREQASLLVQAGICREAGAEARLKKLHRQVLDLLAEKGPSTVRSICQAVPELQAKVRHDVGKLYEGEFSIGSRLVPSMCTMGVLIRTQPRGTWRSSLHEYATLSDWLPELDLTFVEPREARTWLVRRYLSAFGPVTFDDIQWWTGFSKGDTEEALRDLKPAVVELTIEGFDDEYLMLAEEAQQLRAYAPSEFPCVFVLPGLDPYIMGYRDRRRFLKPEHYGKVFDRAGNAMPTVWANGQVVGVWGQRKDGAVTYGLFEEVGGQEQALLAGEAQRLEAFLDGEFLPPRTYTPFTRALKEA